MLLRGRNTVGYTPYPTQVTTTFVHEAARTGIDVFRVFDALNDVSQMRPAIEAVRETGTALAEVALCYTGDLSDPAEQLYTLDYYLRLAEQIVEAGAHVLAIKDMAGLLRPPAAATLVTALRERFDLPVHLHTHDTAGGQLATLMAAWQAGVDAVDGAVASMAGTTSQPPLSAIVAATDHTPYATGLDLTAVNDLEPYWEAVRRVYAPFESGLPSPTGRVYTHEIPGGQLSNLRQQAIALGLGQKFEQVEDMYAAANDILGNVVKVTPSSKVVGDLALRWWPRASTRRVRGRPGVLRHPRLGDRLPQRRARRPARRLARAVPHQGARGPHVAAEPSRRASEDGAAGGPAQHRRSRRSTSCSSPARRSEPSSSHREPTATLSVLPTVDYLYGLRRGTEHAVELREGKTVLLIGVEAISEPDERGMRTVMATLNGQLRPVSACATARWPPRSRRPRRPIRSEPRPGRGAVRRRRHGDRWARATGRGRRDPGHDRGHEDGGRDHRARRRHREPGGCAHDPGRRGRRPGPGAGLRAAGLAGDLQCPDLVASRDDLGVLARDDLAEPGAQVHLEGLLVLRDCVVLAGGRSLEDRSGVVTGQGVLQREPPAVHGRGDRTALVDVVAVLVPERHDLATEAGALRRQALERLGPRGVLAVAHLVCCLGETTLAVLERLHQFLGGLLVVRHVCAPSSVGVLTWSPTTCRTEPPVGMTAGRRLSPC
jgi:hypothetical protein